MYQKEYNMLIDESNRPYELKPLGDASDDEEEQQQGEQENTDEEQEQAPLPWDNTPNKININRNWLYNYWLDHNKETSQVVNDLLRDGYEPKTVTAYRDYIKKEFEKYKH